ncbi:MAG: signal peptidase I [Dehalococcoidia bacterium]|nr:signal peptidase I [Dehalococcoidia bacterium]
MVRLMKPFVRESLETVVLAVLLFLLLRASIQNFRVEGASMEPSLLPHEYVFVNKLAYLQVPVGKIARSVPFWNPPGNQTLYPLGAPRFGDVIVFHAPGQDSRDFVKRVIGLPGDTVALRNGVVYVNARPLSEPYILAIPAGQTLDPVKVPPGQLFVMGDNRPASNDSRAWGPVAISKVIGRVWVRYWPVGEAEFLTSVGLPDEGSMFTVNHNQSGGR